MADSAAPLPTLSVPQSEDEIIAKLDHASRRGRLAGFQPSPKDALFLVDAWGTPFDYDLIAQSQSTNGTTSLQFTLRLRRKMPRIHAIILLLTVWPGVWLTDSLLKHWFGWYYVLTQKPIFEAGGFEFFTYLWYIPLCVLPLPWYWKSVMRRSELTAHASALEMIAKIAGELGAPPPSEPAEAPGQGRAQPSASA